MNRYLRKKIIDMVYKAGEGHIPSAFSIIDIVAHLYKAVLKFDPKEPAWSERDYFVLSKGHGCAALYVVLEKHGFITQKDLDNKSKLGAILGGHPDMTKVPGVEASTGSLGHGIVTALGIALGLKIKKKKNKVIVLVGDGECNEGTVWEVALVAAKLNLGNFCCIVDNNGSTAQVLPMSDFVKKWSSFGWEVHRINGHNDKAIEKVFKKIKFNFNSKPKVIIADTVKGKGVKFMETHGPWHYKVPNQEEVQLMYKELGV
ncbi:MAG: transketolase [Candidatus Omnitrophica bacterium]|nr:transketolase [Candidatus Omnitrophota bacterium]